MAVLAAGLAGVLAVVMTRSGSEVVPPARVDAPRASPAAAAAALASFVDGVESRDASVLVGLAPANDTEAGELLSGIARNTSTLDLRGVTARLVDQVGTVAADGSWTGVVDLTWQFGDLDQAPSQGEIEVSFVPDGHRVGIAGFVSSAAGRTRVPLWLRGELAVALADGVLVMVDGKQAEARRVLDRVTRGTGVVRRVLTDWTGPVVVEVPRSAADLDEALGAASGTYATIAAVTTTAGSATGPDAPVHVFVNPDVTSGLRRAGAQVVMSHELVHVATDAARTPMEPWLLEGFADYVALRDTALLDRTALGRAIASARDHGLPTDLPSAADFDTRARGLRARYEEAWLACRILAERLGERGLVQSYVAVAGGATVEEALLDAGLSSAVLTRSWRQELSTLVR